MIMMQMGPSIALVQLPCSPPGVPVISVSLAAQYVTREEERHFRNTRGTVSGDINPAMFVLCSYVSVRWQPGLLCLLFICHTWKVSEHVFWSSRSSLAR